MTAYTWPSLIPLYRLQCFVIDYICDPVQHCSCRHPDNRREEKREVDDEGRRYKPHSLCLSFKILITLQIQWLFYDIVISVCRLHSLLWAPQQSDEFIGLGWDLPLKMKRSGCKQRKSAPTLFVHIHVCGECECAWVMPAAERTLISCAGESR